MNSLLMAAAALGCALVAGFLLAFSVCVMRALKALPANQGIAAMQKINIVIINPWFLAVFFGTALLCLGVIVAAIFNSSDSRSMTALAGGLVYLLGTIGVTIVFNVPLNNGLAMLTIDSPDADVFWANYLKVWTRWNHVRTCAALLAALLFLSQMSM
jgi:uncharacterized membrane protein